MRTVLRPRSFWHWTPAAPLLSVGSNASTVTHTGCPGAHCRSLCSSTPRSVLLQAVLLTSDAGGSKTVRLSDVSGRPAAAASDAAGLAAMFETAAPGGTKIIRYLHSAPMRPCAARNVAAPPRGSSLCILVQGAALVTGGRALAERHLTAPCAMLVAAMPRQAQVVVAPDAAHRAAAAAGGVAGQAAAVGVAAPAGGAVAVQGQSHAPGLPVAPVHLAAPPDLGPRPRPWGDRQQGV
mmetsp:Transcript_1713/g.2927  ORF Transcript_1713/g.2927 Transcript_1713/m.2927 type:complete len:237 (+) Transcript_1713:127-837(+)